MDMPQEYLLVIIGVLGTLTGIIYKIHIGKIKELSDKLEKMAEGNISKHDNFTNITNLISQNISNIQTNQTNIIRDVADLKKEDIKMIQEVHILDKELLEKIHEIELTVAEQGNVYATKSEVKEQRIRDRDQDHA